jgi:protein-S-isoprenylcysteine O-methyltransferase Ste14
MEWAPALEISWLNGWIFLAVLVLTEGLAFLTLPRAVVARLFDRSGWSKEQTVMTVLGKVFALACLVMIVGTPLRVGSAVLIIGGMVAGAGWLGLVMALRDFGATPPARPVTRGLYRFSRHPQIVMTSIILLGACIAIGSWLALLTLVIARAFGHLGILAEEQVCLAQYGEAYRAYMDRVPRYLILF